MNSGSALRFTHIPHPDRPTILYLHGFLGCKEDWDLVVKSLGNQFGHLRVDLPGHGETGNIPNDQTFTMPGCGAAIVNLVDSLQIDTCHVVGYSMGGRLALHLAHAFPGRFGRFVIESGSPGLKTAAEREERMNRDHQLADSIRTSPLEQFLTSWYNQPLFAGIDKQTETFQNLLTRRLRNDPTGLLRSLTEMGTGAQQSLWADMGRIRPDLLLIVGATDTKFQTIAAEMVNLCPHSQLAILAGAGHNVHLEQPDAYCRRVADFLSPEE